MPVGLMDGYNSEAVGARCESSERWLASQGSWFTKDFAPHSPAMEGDGKGTHLDQGKVSAISAMGDFSRQRECWLLSLKAE
jgi:hypothetical protein